MAKQNKVTGKRWVFRGSAATVAIGVLALLFTPRLRGSSPIGCHAVVGSCPPSFHLPDTSKHWVSLGQYHGRPVMLNFWAVSCPACWQEEPALKRAARSYEPHGLVMLGIDAWGEPLRYVRRYLRHDPFPYRVLLDSAQRVPDLYGMWKTPESVFIDRAGTITAIYPGPIPYSTLSRDIQTILDPRGRGKTGR